MHIESNRKEGASVGVREREMGGISRDEGGVVVGCEWRKEQGEPRLAATKQPWGCSSRLL